MGKASCTRLNTLRDIGEIMSEPPEKIDLFTAIVEIVGRPMSYIDRNYRHLAAYVEFHDTPQDQILGRTVSDLLGREVFENEMKSHLDRALAGEAVLCEIFLQSPLSGNTRWLQLEYFPHRGSTGEIPGVVTHLVDITEQKRTEEALHQSEHQMKMILNSTAEMLAYYDTELRIVWANRAAAESVGMTPEEMTGRYCYEIWHHRSNPCENCPVLKARDEKKACHAENQTPDGRHWSVRGYPVFDENKEVTALIEFTQDITERKQIEEQIQRDIQEKTVLLSEIHHRVKNSLQIVASLLRLQSTKTNDDEVLDLFEQSRKRVFMMASLYEKLYRTKDFARIDFKQHMEEVLTIMHLSSGMKDRVSLKMDLENVVLGLDDAIPVGLIINELFTNSMKHAFPEDRKGTIEIRFERVEDKKSYRLTYRDDGVGLPENVDFGTTDTLGLTLIKTLAQQTQGRAEVEQNGWTTFIIEFFGYGSDGDSSTPDLDFSKTVPL